MADLSDTIESVASGPAEVSGDNTRVRQQSVQDVIAADKYLADKEASSSGVPFGMRFAKCQPWGAV